MTDLDPTSNPHPGLHYGRIAGRILGVILIVWGLFSLFAAGSGGTFDLVRGVYFVVFGVLVNLPFQKLGDRVWKAAFAALCLLAAGFVFVMVVSVMFSYMEYAERGEKLGVPGLEGTLVFLSLLQPPLVLFQRKPDLLD